MPQIAQIGEIFASQLFWLAIVLRHHLLRHRAWDASEDPVDGRAARQRRSPTTSKPRAGAREAADATEEAYRARDGREPRRSRQACRRGQGRRRHGDREAVAKADKAIGKQGRHGRQRRSATARDSRARARSRPSRPKRPQDMVGRVAGHQRRRRQAAAPRCKADWSMAEPQPHTPKSPGVPATHHAEPTVVRLRRAGGRRAGDDRRHRAS